MSETVGERRGFLTVTMTDDGGQARADADLATLKSGTTSDIVRANVSEPYFHQLRLRVAEDPTLAQHIKVLYTDRDGVQHRIGLEYDEELHWPRSFCRDAWDIEVAIQRVRNAPRTTDPEHPTATEG